MGIKKPDPPKLSRKSEDLTSQSLQRASHIMGILERIKGLEFTSKEAEILIKDIQMRTRR